MPDEQEATTNTENESQPSDELSNDELDGVVGGRESTTHPAKVTVPDIKIAISSDG